MGRFDKVRPILGSRRQGNETQKLLAEMMKNAGDIDGVSSRSIEEKNPRA